MSGEVVILRGAKARAYLEGLRVKSTPQMSVEDAVELWVKWLASNARPATASQYTLGARRWSKGVKGVGVHDVTEEHIKPWVNLGGKAGGRAFKLAVLRSLFHFLVAKGITAGNPAALVKVDYNAMTHEQKEVSQAKPFTDQQFAQLIRYCENEIASFQIHIELALNSHFSQSKIDRLKVRQWTHKFWKLAAIISRCTGLRMIDVCVIEKVALTADPFVVWTRKRHKRVVPTILMPELFKQAVDYAHAQSGPFAFPREHERYLSESARATLGTQFAHVSEYAGVPDHTFHGLRRSYAQHCLANGIPIPHIMKNLGHSYATTTEGYLE